MSLHHNEDGSITIVPDRAGSDLAKSAGQRPNVTHDLGQLHHDEEAVRRSQARASGKPTAWGRRRR